MFKQISFSIFLILPNLSQLRTRFHNQNRLTYKECVEEVSSMGRDSIDKLSGRWFEIYSTPFCLTRNSKCVTSFYSTHKDNKSVIYTKLVDEYRMTKRFIANIYSTQNNSLMQTYAISGQLIRFYYHPHFI
jgi:lipocalin